VRKIGLWALALSTLVLSACGSKSTSFSNDLNPASTTVLFETPSGVPATGLAVTLSTGINEANIPTGVIATGTTDSTGHVTFNGLPSSESLCVSASLSVPPNTLFKGACYYPFPATLSIEFQNTNS
jgi:5-hydroxyisourate hydrolase-like protein (transthyretin family)